MDHSIFLGCWQKTMEKLTLVIGGKAKDDQNEIKSYKVRVRSYITCTIISQTFRTWFHSTAKLLTQHPIFGCIDGASCVYGFDLYFSREQCSFFVKETCFYFFSLVGVGTPFTLSQQLGKGHTNAQMHTQLFHY